jgi:ATP-binding cassette subfamily C protein
MKHIVYYMKRLYAFSGSMVYVNVAGMALISVLEGFAILLLIPLINSSEMVHLNTEAIPVLGLFDFLHELPLITRLSVILGFYVLIVIGQNMLNRRLTLQYSRLQQRFSLLLRAETYQSLLQASWSYYIQRRKSDLINVMTIEMARVVAGINQVLTLFRSTIFTVVQIGIAFWLSPAMTLFVLLCGGILAVAMRPFIRRSQMLGHKTSELAQSYLAGITDQLNGIKDIKSNTLERSRIRWLHSVTEGMMKEQLEYVSLRTSSQIVYKITSAVFIAVFLFISILLFRSQPEQLLLIIVIFSRLWPKFSEVQSSMQQIASTIPAFESLERLRLESTEARESIRAEGEEATPVQVTRDIECSQVYFRYNQQEGVYALDNVSLRIPARKMTAIVGRSGAGKSTLIDILMGMLRPEQGQVLIDGVPLAEGNLISWREAISYVPQEPFLYHASIRDNLTMVAPDATEEELREALEFSSAAEFVLKLPDGLDTMIGDRGIRLSGGERQRLVLARAILRKPSVLILDEATSALDTENESKIQLAIERMKGTMTIVVIAHRLSTIRNADQVIVLEEGKLIQSGAFGYLASDKKGMFQKLLGGQEVGS